MAFARIPLARRAPALIALALLPSPGLSGARPGTDPFRARVEGGFALLDTASSPSRTLVLRGSR